MTVRVCTLFWGTAWERYGAYFSESFDEFWPVQTELVVVTDHPVPLRRGSQVSLEAISGYADFKAEWKDDPRAIGLRPPKSTKVDDFGYSWRHDAMKWMPQALAPLAASKGLVTGDILAWLDGDVETTSHVPARWMEKLLGDADIACLQRDGTHSEIGFYAMRFGPGIEALLVHFRDLYLSGRIFDLREHHSAYAFDRALESQPGLKVRNLNNGHRGHVFETSALAKHLKHYKGKRKDLR